MPAARRAKHSGGHSSLVLEAARKMLARTKTEIHGNVSDRYLSHDSYLTIIADGIEISVNDDFRRAR
jgi:hypothetical protein